MVRFLGQGPHSEVSLVANHWVLSIDVARSDIALPPFPGAFRPMPELRFHHDLSLVSAVVASS